MSENIKDFEIKIVTSADLAAAKATSQSFQEIGDAAKKSAAAATEDGQNTAELTQKTGFLSLKKGELKKLVHELGQAFPIAGRAGAMMMNPIMASLSLGIMVFGAAKKKLEEWDAALEASAQRNASHDFLPGIEAKSQAVGQATASMAEFETALENIGRAEDKFKTKISEAIDKLHEFINAQAEVNSAGEAKELAEVDLKQKTGKLDEVGAITQRAAIKERYRKIQDDLKTKGEQDELKLQETELEHDKKSQPGLHQAETAARQKRDALKARQAQAKMDLERGEKKSTEYGDQEGKALEELDKVQKREEQGGYQVGFSGGKVGNAVTQAKETLAEAQRLKAAQERFNSKNRQLIQGISETGLPKAEGELGVAETRVKTNAERINELDRTLPGKREVIGIREQGRGVAGGLKDLTTETEVTTQIAGKLNEGKEKEAGLLKQVNDSAQSGNVVKTAILDALKATEKQNQQLAEQLKAHTARIQSLENSRKLNPPGT